MKEYLDFEIRFAPGPAGYTVYADGPSGNGSSAFVPPSDATYQALAQRLANFDTDEDMLVQLGQTLFSALFQGDVKRVYDKAQAQVEGNQEQGLRLRLNIDPHETVIASLPWEFLNDPDHGPLAMLDTPIIRFIPQTTRPTTLQTTLPLKVLLTGAQTPPPTDVARELEQVEAALHSLGVEVQITVEPHLTPRKFQRLLRETFHVWHFVGHGGYSADGRTARLFLEDDSGGTQTIGATELQILLNRNSIRLIVLDACDSAKVALEPFRSIAPALIRAQIPAVVAMQFRAPEEATQEFASEFYRAVAEGLPIDACVTEGRKAVVLNGSGLGSPDWGIPVVYTRAPDGRLFDLPTSDEQPQPERSSSGAVTQSGGVNINVQGSSLSDSPISVGGSSTSADERNAKLAALNDELRLTRRRLFELQKQKAVFGISADPAILIQIEDLQKDVADLERERQALGG